MSPLGRQSGHASESRRRCRLQGMTPVWDWPHVLKGRVGGPSHAGARPSLSRTCRSDVGVLLRLRVDRILAHDNADHAVRLDEGPLDPGHVADTVESQLRFDFRG